MLFWGGRLRVDFLPSFELISGVTHAILDEVRECRAGDLPLAFRHAAGQIRDEGLVRTRPRMSRWPQPKR
jgi:hypothetical protein